MARGAGARIAWPCAVMRAVTLLLYLSGASHAWAHAVLVDQVPKAGATLAQPPAEILLTFNEPVVAGSVRLLDREGRSIVSSTMPSAGDTTMHLAPPRDLPGGAYIVSYRVLSADSHPVGGSFAFSIGNAVGAAARVSTEASRSRDSLWLALRGGADAALLGALLLCVGGAFYALWSRFHGVGATRSPMVTASCVVAAVAAIASLMCKAAYLFGDPLRDLAQPALWNVIGQVAPGPATAAVVTGVAVIAVAGGLPSHRWRTAAAVGGAGLSIAGVACSGHVVTAPPRWVAAPAVALHMLAAALWIGALPLLRRALVLPSRDAAAAAAARFSRAATLVVALLVVCGIVITIVQVQSLAAMTSTSYGRLLCLKLALVVALLIVAGRNRWRLTPRLAHGANGGASALRRSISVELGIAACIVVVTASLGQTPPPRALTEGSSVLAQEKHIVARSAAGDRVARIDVVRHAAGRYRLVVGIQDNDGRTLSPLEVTMGLSNPALGIEPAVYTATSQGGGRYAVDDAWLPVAGVWRLTVNAVVSDFDTVAFDADLDVGS